MREPKSIFAWINCYGGWDPGLRTPIETIGYDQYLDGIVKALTPFKDRVTGIVVSGGMRDVLGRTECETTKPELQLRFSIAGFTALPEIESDEHSITSISIARAFVRRAAKGSTNTSYLLFVDSVRYESNLYTVDYFCEQYSYPIQDVRQCVVPIPRLDDHPHSSKEFQDKKLLLMKERGIEAIEQEEKDRRREITPSLKL